MKKITSRMTFIKKNSIFTVFIISGVFLPVVFAQAGSVVFNTGVSDPPTFQAYNFTRLGFCSSCWQSSVSADQNDIITMRVYYHNNSDETALNTKIRISLPGGSFTNQSATGEVFANNAASSLGTVSINLSSSQSLSFVPDSVKWYPDRGTETGTTRSLPFGQNGSELFTSSGLNIGNIEPGYAHDGYLVFAVKVSGSNQQIGGAPIVNTNSASSIGQNSATLNGSVNPNNSNTTVWFEYGTTQNLGTTVGNQSVGNANSNQNIIAYLSNLSPNTTYYFRAVAQNSFGITYGAIMSFTTGYQQSQQIGGAPIVNTNSASSIGQNSATLNGSVNPNNSNTTVWFEYGPTQYLGYTTGYQNLGNANYFSNASAYLNNLSPNTTYYFRIVAQNAYGTSYGSLLSFNTLGGYSAGGNYQPQNAAPIVNTLQATYVYQNSALINGSVNPNGSLTTAWFEWGKDYNLGNKSESRAVGSGYEALNFNSILSGLDAGTTYYYRAAAQNSFGTSYGNTVAIKTQSYNYTPPPEQKIITRTVVVKTGALLDLSLNNEEVNAGDDIIISATFKNENSSAINDVVLKIALPAEVKYLSASPRVSNRENGILTFNLGKIGAKTQGVVTVKVNVNSDAKQNSVLIFGGTLEYNDKNNNFQSIESYATARVIQGEVSGLGASLLDALRGIFTSPWFYIILLLIAVGITAWYFGKRSVMKATL